MARILMVIRRSKGGGFRHVVQLSEAMVARGHAVAICGPHAARSNELAAEVIDVPLARDPSSADDLRAVRALAAAYRRYQPDLIHAHGSKGGALARLARIARPRTPLVFTPHNYAFANWSEGRLGRAVYRASEVALAPLATRVICVCEAERKLASGLGSSRKLRVVYNGIDPFRQIVPNERADELKARGPLLVAVTELWPPKGVVTLIDAVPAILAACPTVTLAIAGEGYMRAEIEEGISRLGLGDRVLLLGQIPDVSGLLAAADLFVSPSWSESFPYAVLEAMSLAAPILATDVGGVGEAIEDGLTGRLVRARDPVALAAAAADLLTNPQRARDLGEAAQARVLDRFTVAQTVRGVLDVYAELEVE